MEELRKLLRRERSKILDKEYPGSIGALEDEKAELLKSVELINSRIDHLRKVERDLDAGVKAIERLLTESGIY